MTLREPFNACAVCGRSGFPDATMSITEAGATCQGCYAQWQQRQRDESLAADRAAKEAVGRFRQRALAVVLIVVAVLFVVSVWRHARF